MYLQKVMSKKTKKSGSGVGSGSISQRYGSTTQTVQRFRKQACSSQKPCNTLSFLFWFATQLKEMRRELVDDVMPKKGGEGGGG
jgi:hypothetical protein